MRGSSLFPVFLLFFACMGCKAGYTDFLIGDWYRMDDYILVEQSDLEKIQRKTTFWSRPPRPPVYNPFGLTFHSDSSVTFYPDLWRNAGGNWVYHGEIGKYSVTKDSLWLAMPSDSLFSRSYAWSKKGNNSMIMKGTNGNHRYNRFFTKIKNYQKIDSIKQYISDGWGYLEEKAVSRSGKTTWFKPVFGEPVEEHYTGNISKEEFQKLEFRYNWAGFMELGDYSACCDGREIETVFYFGGKEIKRVIDYMASTPMRYLWASSMMNSFVERSALNKIEHQTDARQEP